MPDSIFTDEWRDCLREHYKYVIRKQDNVTRKTLEPVLEKMGFREDELRELQVQATMHVDDVSEDFVPQLDILEQVEEPTRLPDDVNAHPLECQCPACVEINMVPHDEEGQPLSEEEISELELEQAEQNDDDAPQQLSLF